MRVRRGRKAGINFFFFFFFFFTPASQSHLAIFFSSGTMYGRGVVASLAGILLLSRLLRPSASAASLCGQASETPCPIALAQT
ncbi:hypothetical protein IWX48DRAFT_96338 [Phyllosticta citricarpa]